MNSFHGVEIAGVCIIVLVQVLVFFRTLTRIRKYKTVFDETENSSVVKVDVPVEELNNQPPSKIIESLPRYQGELADYLKMFPEEAYLEIPVKEISLITPCTVRNSALQDILTSLNTYLIKNRGVASDFHLIKDVVERNTDNLDEDISHTISLPLYLGLLGTMLGIVFGLFNISSISEVGATDDAMGEGIGVLLGGVKIAMIASFTGLMLTIINNGWYYKKARHYLEARKNRFYTFIQTELLPVLNQNINSTLHSLQNNLHKFNDNFSHNVEKLSSVMNKNYDSLRAQEKVLDTLKTIDINRFSEANIKVLQQLNISVEKFDEFNKYLGEMNKMLYGTKVITQKVNDLVERTDDFVGIAKKAGETFELSHNLQRFLHDHYSALETSQQVFDEKLSGVNDVLYTSLDQLKEFTKKKIQEVQEITVREVHLMESEYPEKWKKLDNLEHLNALNKNVSDIKMSSAGQIGSLKGQVEDINEKMDALVKELAVLTKSKEKQSRSIKSKMLNFVKGFGKKKVEHERA